MPPLAEYSPLLTYLSRYGPGLSEQYNDSTGPQEGRETQRKNAPSLTGRLANPAVYRVQTGNVNKEARPVEKWVGMDGQAWLTEASHVSSSLTCHEGTQAQYDHICAFLKEKPRI